MLIPTIITKLFLSVTLAGLIGLEREKLEKSAGLRTMMLIALSSTLLTLISLSLPEYANNLQTNFDIGRIIAYMVAGVGFLGSGIILKIKESKSIAGLTTASCLWGVLAIGVLCGLEMYQLAGIATLFILAILKISWGFKNHKHKPRRRRRL